ncbi:TRAP transporter substrate-binding protein [Burkholderiaceae bacterium FT117]|uniref:TRAP transporter substrate-binding protein n=1 Tax=Zeimonas sediminis TaxID=2944268 RepID=UPI002343216B|nr:TRAP transporter substrate-binding protein [Zeimonas sediminis]MCM5568948.1 TRAP transporter substrate-binding protein [Zeimonas sediminis]
MAFKRLAAAALAVGMVFGGSQAIAQDKKVRAQMGWAFPSTTGLLGPAQTRLVEMIRTMSGGSIDVKGFEPGALVPANQYLDAVGNGSLDMAFTVSAFWTGKDIAFALYGAVPFGPEGGEYIAWLKHGGGEKLMKELHAKYNVEVIPCGLISPEASGWFRKEIKSVEDLKGLKMRFLGLGANVMQKFGVATQLLQAGEIFQALQLGTIDATEFSMPIMDATLGFHQVAKHYYFPGWHQQSTLNELIISKKKWAEFSPNQKAIIQNACDANMLQMFADGEASQFAVLQDLQKNKGVTLHRWPKEILAQFEKAWEEVAAEQSAKSPDFKKGYESYTAFRKNYKIWQDLGYLR